MCVCGVCSVYICVCGVCVVCRPLCVRSVMHACLSLSVCLFICLKFNQIVENNKLSNVSAYHNILPSRKSSINNTHLNTVTETGKINSL